jgi:hypothetical protein
MSGIVLNLLPSEAGEVAFAQQMTEGRPSTTSWSPSPLRREEKESL